MSDSYAELMGSPWVILFLVVVELVLIAMVSWIVWFLKFEWPRAARKMSWYARKISKFSWYVREVHTYEGKGTIVELVSHSMPRHEMELYFRKGHPDQSLAALLRKLQLVRFAPAEPGKDQIDFELAPHLRIILDA